MDEVERMAEPLKPKQAGQTAKNAFHRRLTDGKQISQSCQNLEQLMDCEVSHFDV